MNIDMEHRCVVQTNMEGKKKFLWTNNIGLRSINVVIKLVE